MTISDAYTHLLNVFNSLKNGRASVVFLRKSDDTFLGTDIAVSGFLNDPELYSVEDNPKLNEIVVGLFKDRYSIVNDSTNAIVSIG